MKNLFNMWLTQDSLINKQDIKLYEGFYRRFKDPKLKKLAKAGLELLYAERKSLALRKTNLGSQAGIRVLRWRGEGTAQPVRGADLIAQELTNLQQEDVGVENGFDDLGCEDINGEVGFGLTDGD
jgi:hypothetical protein